MYHYYRDSYFYWAQSKHHVTLELLYVCLSVYVHLPFIHRSIIHLPSIYLVTYIYSPIYHLCIHPPCIYPSTIYHLLSIHLPSIHPSVYLFIYSVIIHFHLSIIHSSIHPSFLPSAHVSTQIPSYHPLISIYLSTIHPTINHPSIYLFLSIHPSIYFIDEMRSRTSYIISIHFMVEKRPHPCLWVTFKWGENLRERVGWVQEFHCALRALIPVKWKPKFQIIQGFPVYRHHASCVFIWLSFENSQIWELGVITPNLLVSKVRMKAPSLRSLQIKNQDLQVVDPKHRYPWEYSQFLKVQI